MPDMLALSESAIALLRFRIKGYRMPVTEPRREVFRELVDAGLMEPDGRGDYRFTEDDPERRQRWLDAAEAYLHSLEPRLPARIDLSDAGRDALNRHLAGDQEVTDANREAYRELAAAGIMVSVGTFTKGDDCVFQFTRQGWERRHEFQRPFSRLSASAIARSLSRAVSRIAKGVSAAR